MFIVIKLNSRRQQSRSTLLFSLARPAQYQYLTQLSALNTIKYKIKLSQKKTLQRNLWSRLSSKRLGCVMELRVNSLFKIIGQEADFTKAQGKRLKYGELLIFKNNFVWLRLWMFVITHWILFTFAQILMWPTGKENIINFYNNKHKQKVGSIQKSHQISGLMFGKHWVCHCQGMAFISSTNAVQSVLFGW